MATNNTVATLTVVTALDYVEDCISGGVEQACISSAYSEDGNETQVRPLSGKDKTVCNSNACQCWAEDHQPGILYCNLCMYKDAVVDPDPVNTFEGTSPQYLCDNCEGGLGDWRWTGSTIYKVTTPVARPAMAFLLWKNDLCTTGAEITIYADGEPVQLSSHDGVTAVISPSCEDHCTGEEGDCAPVALYWNWKPGTDPVVAREWCAVITANGQHRAVKGGFYLVHTENICLYQGDIDPTSMSRYEQKTQQDGCGALPPILKKRTGTKEVNLINVTESFVKGSLKKLTNYGNRYPMYWANSINRCPNEIYQISNLRNDGMTLNTCTQTGVLTFDFNPHGNL